MDQMKVSGILMNLELFEGLEYDQIQALMGAAQERVLEAGEVLSEVQTVDHSLGVFLEGRLRIESQDGIPLTDVTRPRILGEMGAFTGMARSSRVVAAEKSVILELAGDSLEGLVESDPEIGQRLLGNLCKVLYERIHGANEEIHQLRVHLSELNPEDPLLEG